MSDYTIVNKITTQDGNVIIPFKQSRYDLLEESLLALSNKAQVFETLAKYMHDNFNVSFVVALHRDSSEIQHFQTFNDSYDARIETIIKQRLSSTMPQDIFCIHSTGDVSLPYTYERNKRGYIFLGRSNEPFSDEEINRFFLIVRVINKVMIYMELLKVNRDKTVLRDAFSRFVTPGVADSISNVEKDDFANKKMLSIMWTRLEEFATISKSIPPQSLVNILNLYLTEMRRIIVDLGGTIGKFEGDTIIAFFGANRYTDHATRCCLAALRMKKMEDSLNRQLQEEALITKPLRTAIGINAGLTLLLNISADDSKDYTVLGASVATAQKIESLNKFYNTYILVSGDTINKTSDNFKTKLIGKAQLHELGRDISLYELVDSYEDRLLQFALDTQEPEEDMVEM